VKVLTGDNLDVSLKVYHSLDLVTAIDNEHIQAINGPDISLLEDVDFCKVIKHCKIFAKLTLTQKGQVITSLKCQNEIVDMLSDGINSCIALHTIACRISMDKGTNVAKDCPDIIFTENKLSIVTDSALIGASAKVIP